MAHIALFDAPGLCLGDQTHQSIRFPTLKSCPLRYYPIHWFPAVRQDVEVWMSEFDRQMLAFLQIYRSNI